MNEITDISNDIDENEEINCICPLCDNPIEEDEIFRVVQANGFIGLAHIFCIEEFTDIGTWKL